MASSSAIAVFVRNHIQDSQGHSSHLLDVLMPKLDLFLKFVGVNRPACIYDSQGKRLFQSQAYDYSEAIVAIRTGIDGQSFQVIVPPFGFECPARIPVPREQGSEWHGYQTSFIAPDNDSFYYWIAIERTFTCRATLLEAVQNLTPDKGPPKILGDHIPLEVTPLMIRRLLAKWIITRHPEIAERAMIKAKSSIPLLPLRLTPKPGVIVTEEELTLALYYLQTDRKLLWIQAVRNGSVEDVPSHVVDHVSKPQGTCGDGLKELIADSPHMVWSVNRFYANVNMSYPNAGLAEQDDPLAAYAGQREIPIANFFVRDVRAIEAPFVSELAFKRVGNHMTLPHGIPLRLASVGGGISSAFQALMWAQIAHNSKRHITFTAFESCSDPFQLGRLMSVVSQNGLVGEGGAMRKAGTSLIFFDLVENLIGPDVKAKTFPNQHIVKNFFILRSIFGQRGLGAREDSFFTTVIEPTLQYIQTKLRDIHAEVEGEKITFGDIMDYLLFDNQRTANKSQLMLTAFFEIARTYNVTLDQFFRDAISDGLRQGHILGSDKSFRETIGKPRGTAASMVEAENLILDKMDEERRIGGGTSGWKDYGNLSVVEQLSNETIGPYDEFLFQDFADKGLQDIGRRMRDHARQIGGDFFTLNWELGAEVRGLGLGGYEPRTKMQRPSALVFQRLDPRTASDVGSQQIREFHCITTTVNSAVLARTVAPQTGGPTDSVVLKGLDDDGQMVARMYDKPYKVYVADEAELDLKSTSLKSSNYAVRNWAEQSQMVNAQKTMFVVDSILYDAISPKDHYVPCNGSPTCCDVPARWALIPCEQVGALQDSLEYRYPGTRKTSCSATLRFLGIECEWHRISLFYYESLPTHHSVCKTTEAADTLNFLPICAERLSEFCVAHQYPVTVRLRMERLEMLNGRPDVVSLYGQANSVSIIDGEKVVWMPTCVAISEEDPIYKRMHHPRLSRQSAFAYVAPKQLAKDIDLRQFFGRPTQQMTPHNTRLGASGVFFTVPVERSNIFEHTLERLSYSLITQDTLSNRISDKSVYKVTTEGEPPLAIQLPGSLSAGYVHGNGEQKLFVAYEWARAGNKTAFAAKSDFGLDRSSNPLKELAAAHNHLFGSDDNFLRILVNNAKEQATINFQNNRRFRGSFSVLGVNDLSVTWPVAEFHKLAIVYDRNPTLVRPPCIQPTGESASINVGWVDPGLRKSRSTVLSLAKLLGARLSPVAVSTFMGASPLPAFSQLEGNPYPSYGLAQEEGHSTYGAWN